MVDLGFEDELSKICRGIVASSIHIYCTLPTCIKDIWNSRRLDVFFTFLFMYGFSIFTVTLKNKIHVLVNSPVMGYHIEANEQ